MGRAPSSLEKEDSVELSTWADFLDDTLKDAHEYHPELLKSFTQTLRGEIGIGEFKARIARIGKLIQDGVPVSEIGVADGPDHHPSGYPSRPARVDNGTSSNARDTGTPATSRDCGAKTAQPVSPMPPNTPGNWPQPADTSPDATDTESPATSPGCDAKLPQPARPVHPNAPDRKPKFTRPRPAPCTSRSRGLVEGEPAKPFWPFSLDWLESDWEATGCWVRVKAPKGREEEVSGMKKVLFDDRSFLEEWFLSNSGLSQEAISRRLTRMFHRSLRKDGFEVKFKLYWHTETMLSTLEAYRVQNGARPTNFKGLLDDSQDPKPTEEAQ